MEGTHREMLQIQQLFCTSRSSVFLAVHSAYAVLCENLCALCVKDTSCGVPKRGIQRKGRKGLRRGRKAPGRVPSAFVLIRSPKNYLNFYHRNGGQIRLIANLKEYADNSINPVFHFHTGHCGVSRAPLLRVDRRSGARR